MEAFFDRLIVRAATIDEILSDDFETLPGQKGDADLAAQRLAAWCRASASGDWSLFSCRLERDGLSIEHVLARFATARRKSSDSAPLWIRDAIWIEAALHGASEATPALESGQREPCAFEHLLLPVVKEADTLLFSSAYEQTYLAESARADLRHSLLTELAELFSPALYELFALARKTAGASETERTTALYDNFIIDMKAGGFRRLFNEKPVLLRLAAIVVRQWIEASGEFLFRLSSDIDTIRERLLRSNKNSRVVAIEGSLSDPHNGGRSVLIAHFDDDARIVYKPKDLRLDDAWHSFIEQLNQSGSPIKLKSARAIAYEGYGWSEFIQHTGCSNLEGCKQFFNRAGGWLALFHWFFGTDMHQENLIAAGDHPVPIDLETILQAGAEQYDTDEPEAQAFKTASEIIENSVAAVGLLPAYAKTPQNNIYSVGGMASDLTPEINLGWTDINSDMMRPFKTKGVGSNLPNVPHIDGHYAKLGDHINDFIGGFEGYARFLLHLARTGQLSALYDKFAGGQVRKVIRPTQLYYMLLRRLKNHRRMGDGVIWSAQADFLARLSDWDKDSDLFWPLQRAERTALLTLNVPYFFSSSDGQEINDASGISVHTSAVPGLTRARTQSREYEKYDIAWQVDVIRQSKPSLLGLAGDAMETHALLRPESAVTPPIETFLAEADKVAAEISNAAIRVGPGAAWIGLDWLGDSNVWQLVALGPDLYNGLSGIALFLSAHAAVTGCASSAELALAAVAHLRKNLRGRNSARLARSLGLGGGNGLGSVIYSFSLMSKFLSDDKLLADARAAAELCTDDIIAADNYLDIMAGSAGAILGLLRLHRDTSCPDVLARAIRCGEHLLAQPRIGMNGNRSWSGLGSGPQPLSGMSHGAAGFAYALAALASRTGYREFFEAASECVAFENASYHHEHSNWPDFQSGQPEFLCQWCYGAPGIGLARMAMHRLETLDSQLLMSDIENALVGVERSKHRYLDTLCCGTLGIVEFFSDASRTLGRRDLGDRASRLLAAVIETADVKGDYRWNGGTRQFNFGLFRGLAGVGYTMLRRAERSLPNVLVWE